MTVKKEDLVASVYNKTGMSKSESRFVVETLFDIMKETLESGEEILISGFGKFRVKEKKERRGRNPQTGEDLQLRARRVLVFKSSRVLRKKINSSGAA